MNLIPPQQRTLREAYSADSMPTLTYASSQSSHEASSQQLKNMHSFTDTWNQPQEDQFTSGVVPSFSDGSLARIMSPPTTIQPARQPSKHLAGQSSITMIPLLPNKRRRIRVESASAINHVQPGFPYRNSTNLLLARPNSGKSSDDSSDEVDLDLSHDFDQPFPQPPSTSGSNSRMGRSRSASRLDFYTEEQYARGFSRESLVPTDPADGWSFNRTPILSPTRELVSNSSLHSKRRGVSPLRIFLGSSTADSSRSPSPSSTPTSSSFRRGSRGTDLSSPLSDALRTPRTPQALHSHVHIVDPDSIGSSRGRSIKQFEINEYQKQSPTTRSTFPYNLFTSLGRASQFITSSSTTPTSPHFPSDPSPPPLPASSAFPSSLSPPNLAGLGFVHPINPTPSQSVPSLAITQSIDHEQELPFSPLSPPSPASPSPGSPLLGEDSSPAVRFDLQDDFQTELAEPSPQGIKPLWLVSNHKRTATSVGKHRHKRSASRKLSRRFSISAIPTQSPDIPDVDLLLPARTFLWLGFLLGPWCWIIGGFYLSKDGEVYGLRRGLCRCYRGSRGPCPVVAHEMRATSGQGSIAEVDNLVKINRYLAVLSGVGISVACAIAIWVVVLHW